MNYMKHSFQSTTSSSSSSSNLQDDAVPRPSSSLNGCVRFNDLISTSQPFNDREKHLTAKYPQHQMQLIRKRLKVEFWLDDQLRHLYDIKDDSSQEDYDHCPGDLIDSLLDIDDEPQRRTFLLDKLRNVKQSRKITMEFIDELLQRVKIL